MSKIDSASKEKIKETRNLIMRFYKMNYQGIAADWKILVNETLNDKKEEERLSILEKYIPISKKWKILEVGAGFGNMGLFLTKKGYLYSGIEPDRECFEIIQRRFKLEGIKKVPVWQAPGEDLPFGKDIFDLVISFQALEHVQDVDKVIEECKRVSKKGSYLYLVFPNYNSFWEPHYAIFFPLFLGKSCFKLWLTIHGKNIKFLDEVNFVTIGKVKKLLKKASYEVIDTGKGLFKYRFRPGKVPGWGQTATLKRVASIFIRLKLNRLLASLLSLLEMHYPANIVARKDED
ncbi:MAG: class I SAM-dependent methyltransferase [Patescibacteria group bacterium]